jgi:hypothetical protein
VSTLTSAVVSRTALRPIPGCDPSTFSARPPVPIAANATAPRTPVAGTAPIATIAPPAHLVLAPTRRRTHPCSISIPLDPGNHHPTPAVSVHHRLSFLFGPRPRSRTPMVRGRGRGPNRPPTPVNIGQLQPWTPDPESGGQSTPESALPPSVHCTGAARRAVGRLRRSGASAVSIGVTRPTAPPRLYEGGRVVNGVGGSVVRGRGRVGGVERCSCLYRPVDVRGPG